jgi:hypothetical protein
VKVPLGRIMAMRERVDGDKVLREAIQRLRLAISEIRVVERWKDKQLVSRTVANQAAIVRARQVYLATVKVIEQVRQEEPLLGTRPGIQAALVELEKCRQEIERLQGLTA